MTPEQELQIYKDFDNLKLSDMNDADKALVLAGYIEGRKHINILKEELKNNALAMSIPLISDYEDKAKKLEKENNILRRALNKLMADVNSGEHLDAHWITNTLSEEITHPVITSSMKLMESHKEKEEVARKELEAIRTELNAVTAFCYDYQMYIQNILHITNVFKTFHELRKGAYAYAKERSVEVKWSYEGIENAQYFTTLKSYITELKERLFIEQNCVDNLLSVHGRNDEELRNYEWKMCCYGEACGCFGRPIEPEFYEWQAREEARRVQQDRRVEV